MPTPPAVRAAATPVAPGIFGRATALVARIKTAAGYTEAIGQDLDIIGAEQTVDVHNLKPVLQVEMQAGHPVVKWKKQGMDGLEIHVDRGDGTFSFLALDTQPDYPDTAPLPAPGQSVLWRYKALYRLNDEAVGQWSDVSSIAVNGQSFPCPAKGRRARSRFLPSAPFASFAAVAGRRQTPSFN